MNGSSWAILSHSSLLGGGAPVAFHSLSWPGSSSIMSESICLATFLRSAEIDFGIAQPQMSFHAKCSLRLGPSGKYVMLILPATLDFAGSLKVAQYTESPTVKAASPAMNTALASLRS